jgi:hypothetical protein
MENELQFLTYNTPQENAKIDVVVKDGAIWLAQKTMAALFDVQVPAISKHLKNIFKEGELDEKVVVSILEITTPHGAISDKSQTKNAKFYHLDAIISVGYRVNSARATQFRIWATSVLREHLLRGYTIKQPASMEQLRELRDELDEVLERQSKMDTFVYEEFGKVYELLTEIIKQKKIEDKPRNPIGYKTGKNLNP